MFNGLVTKSACYTICDDYAVNAKKYGRIGTGFMQQHMLFEMMMERLHNSHHQTTYHNYLR